MIQLGSVPICTNFDFELLNSLFFFAKEPIIELSFFALSRLITL